MKTGIKALLTVAGAYAMHRGYKSWKEQNQLSYTNQSQPPKAIAQQGQLGVVNWGSIINGVGKVADVGNKVASVYDSVSGMIDRFNNIGSGIGVGNGNNNSGNNTNDPVLKLPQSFWTQPRTSPQFPFPIQTPMPQAPTPVPPPAKQGMSTTAIVAIGVGAAAVLGTGIYLVVRKKK